MKEHGGIDNVPDEVHKAPDVQRQTTNQLIDEWNRLKTMDITASTQNNHHPQNMDKIIGAEKPKSKSLPVQVQVQRPVPDGDKNKKSKSEVIDDGIAPNFNFQRHTMHPQMEKYIHREFGMIIDHGGIKEKYNYVYVREDGKREQRELEPVELEKVVNQDQQRRVYQEEEEEEKMDTDDKTPI